MFKNIREILSEASDVIIARGQSYYEDGMITSMANTDETTIEAQVLGSGDFPYTVEIVTDGSGTITDCFCDCPYDYEGICKHIAAVLLMLENEEASVMAQISSASVHPSAQQVLDTLNEQQMREFLRGRIAADKTLAKALCDQFTKPDSSQELASIRHALQQLCQQADCAWENWQMTQQLYDKTEVHAEQARLRLSQGHHLLAAQIALEVLKACFHMIEAIDNGSDFYDIVNDAVDVLCEAAATTGRSDEEQSLLGLLETAVKWCAKWGFEDAVEQLLEGAVQLLPSDKRSYVHSLLEKVEQEWCVLPRDATQRLEVRLIEHFEGAKAASAYRMAHLENDSFRTAAIEQSLAAHDHQRAAEYCRERLELCEHKYARRHWLELLLRVYQADHHEEGQLQVLTELVVLQPSVHYEELRQIYVQRGTWEQAWPALREQLKAELRSEEYMFILHREQQWPQLMEMVAHRPDTITAYGKELMQYDRQHTIRLYEAMIQQRARSAMQRSMYAHACDGIHALYKAGGRAEALHMIEQLQTEFKRKPAFQDELNKVREKMKP